jgi:Putative peptidoglycan binding domain/OmpA family
MSDESSGIVRSTSGGGVAGNHLAKQSRSVLVAPSTSDEYNTIRAVIVPIACWRVDDIRFEFGSSFIKPDARDEMQELDSLMKEHPDAPLSIFGHADPVGQDDFNKQLSGRRAQAIYGMLIRDTDLWEDLYKRPLADDKWGFRSIQLMLENVGHSPGSIDGVQGSQTTDAIKAFQEEKGLAVDGNAGSSTRRELFKAYMDMICVDREEKPYQLDSEKNFLAQGADKNGKGDYQGCSEFNPRLLFSQEEEAEYKKWANREKRNTENAPNRRVIIYLFRPGSKVTPEKWPCPSVKGGAADCKKRFWSDGERRRSERLPDARREYEETKDTFACRFYDRLSDKSPCERVLSMIRIRLFDLNASPIPHAPYLIRIGDRTVSGRADANGDAIFGDLLIPVFCRVYWSHQQEEGPKPVEPEDFEYESLVNIIQDETEGDEGDETSIQRLHNLGYSRHEFLEENVREFQLDLDKPDEELTGRLEDIKGELKECHANLSPPPRTPK